MSTSARGALCAEVEPVFLVEDLTRSQLQQFDRTAEAKGPFGGIGCDLSTDRDRELQDRSRLKFGRGDRVQGDEERFELGEDRRVGDQGALTLGEDRHPLRQGLALQASRSPVLRGRSPWSCSFLFSLVATFSVRASPVALKPWPKPSRFAVSFLVEATFSWLPPTLAKSGVFFAFSSMLRNGTLRLPLEKTIVPSWVTSALAVVGSDLPPETGRVMTLPLSLAGALAETLTPCFFREERKALSRLSLVVPPPIGS